MYLIAEAIQNDIVMPAIRRWQSGGYRTLGAMKADIEATCRDETKFNQILSDNEDFSNAVESWIEYQVGHDIALELQGIAHKHNVFDFSVDQLNAFKELSITIDTPVNGAIVTKLVPAQEIAYALAAVVGVVGWIILPYITGFILGLVGLFFETLVINILLLMANPVTTLFGFAAIALLLGAGVVVGYKENKGQAVQGDLQLYKEPGARPREPDPLRDRNPVMPLSLAERTFCAAAPYPRRRGSFTQRLPGNWTIWYCG